MKNLFHIDDMVAHDDVGISATNRKINLSIINDLQKVGAKTIPPYITTKHLTLASILWIILASIGSHLSKLCLPIALIGHALTDTWDGHMGRIRNEGYIRWGFYMDHILDFFIVFAYAYGVINILNIPQKNHIYIWISAICIAGAIVHGCFSRLPNTHVQSEYTIGSLLLYPSIVEFAGAILVLLLIVFDIRWKASYTVLCQCVAFVLLLYSVYTIWNKQKTLSDYDEKRKYLWRSTATGNIL